MWPRGWVEVQLYSSMTAALEGGEWSAACPGRTFPPGKDPVPTVQEAGWALGPVWTGGKSRPTGIRFPDCPACSQSLYRLSYLAHIKTFTTINNGHVYLHQARTPSALFHTLVSSSNTLPNITGLLNNSIFTLKNLWS